MSKGLIPIKVAKVTSNDEWPLIYIPADAKRLLGLSKGVRVLICIDPERKSLVIERVKTANEVESEKGYRDETLGTQATKLEGG